VVSELRPSSSDATPGPLVSIIVVTYGTGPVILDTLDAVARWTTVTHEVIVVDGLPDDPATRTSRLLSDRTDITLYELDHNPGFAGGNEYGVEQATGEYLCFLNPDAIVTEGWLEPLLRALDDPVVAIAAPVFLDEDGSLQEAGQLIFRDTFTAAVGGPDAMPGDMTNAFSRDVDYASAACWVVRRADHLAIGGFDRRFHPAYFEDADYALRTEAAGRRTRLVADVPIVHLRGRGIGHRDPALGQVTHARFKQQYADRLADRPARPTDDDQTVAARDRLVTASRLVVAWSHGVAHEAWTAAFDGSRRAAAAAPRERVTFLTDRTPPTSALQRARADGLEVVIAAERGAEARELERRRRAMADDVTELGGRPGRQIPRSRWTWIIAGVVLLAGVVLRWLLLHSTAAVINADEAYTRIEAFEILHGRFPVVLGGTVYTFPVEAYLYTPFASMFGANVVPLKLLSTLSWLLAMPVVYMLARRLAGRRAGLFAAAMFWFTPGALLLLSITAYPAYASGMLATSVALLLASMVVDAEHPRRRTMALFGAAAGFAFWLHPMFLSTMVPTVAFVLWTHRRRLEAWMSVVVGGILGCLPFLLWNAVNGWPSSETPADAPGTYIERLRTFAEDLLPRGFGLRDGGLAWYDDRLGPVLALALLVLTGLGVWTMLRQPAPRSRMLALVVLAGVFPMMALFRNLIYANDGRYAIISFPLIVVVMAVGLDRLAGRRPPWRVAAVVGLVGLVWVASLVRPTVSPHLDALGTDPNTELREIVDVLDAAGIDRIYGSYWATLPVDFAGDDRIVSGVFPFWPIRFPDRQRVVGATPPDQIAVVFLGSDEDQSNLLMPADRYERIVIGSRVVYLPVTAARRAGLAD
jgi:GT2 family glycosyltransferase/4-amino-4-deoxy-L-arabinose transferase-like glycosyltransferase